MRHVADHTKRPNSMEQQLGSADDFSLPAVDDSNDPPPLVSLDAGPTTGLLMLEPLILSGGLIRRKSKSFSP